MAHVVFYEKPGCINNSRQKELLLAAGHHVQAASILDHPWTAEELKTFFGNTPPAECLNSTAPAVKSGELNPLDYTGEALLEAMVSQPILIKRPLMVIDNEHFIQGFDKEKIHALIGLSPGKGTAHIVEKLMEADIVTCSRLGSGRDCDNEDEA